MCTQAQLHQILDHFAISAKNIYHEHLLSLTLFGSYARGDQDDGSDIDVLLLVDLDKMEIKHYRNELAHVASELELKYDIVLSPIVLNSSEYNQFKDISGFLRNVQREGVPIRA